MIVEFGCCTGVANQQAQPNLYPSSKVLAHTRLATTSWLCNPETAWIGTRDRSGQPAQAQLSVLSWIKNGNERPICDS